MKRQPRQTAHRRGAVIIEFVFCLPLLGGLMALIFFFGWSLMNQQHVKAAARYSAWKHVYGGDPAGLDVNKVFFRDKAKSLGIHYSGGSDQTLQDYVAEVSASDSQAGALARKLALETFPKGSQANVSAEFKTDVRLWQQFQGSIQSQRGRDGVEWRRGQAELMEPLKDQFLDQLDSTLKNIPGSGRHLGQMVRQLYLAYW